MQLFETFWGSQRKREEVARQRGLTLAEILVGIVLVIILAVF